MLSITLFLINGVLTCRFIGLHLALTLLVGLAMKVKEVSLSSEIMEMEKKV